LFIGIAQSVSIAGGSEEQGRACHDVYSGETAADATPSNKPLEWTGRCQFPSSFRNNGLPLRGSVRRMVGRLRTQSFLQPCGGALRKPSGQFDGDLARVDIVCEEV